MSEVPSIKELYEIYYAVPPNVRAHGEWRMSTDMRKALEDAYGPKPDDDSEDTEPDEGLPPMFPPAMLFGLRIIVDERFPQPKVVEPIKEKIVVTMLTPGNVDQILSALRNRGDHKNGDPAWRGLYQRFDSYAAGFLAGEEAS
jgi:hypothetical protein